MLDQDKHIEVLKILSTLDPGTEVMGQVRCLVKTNANDIINAGRRLEELKIYNFIRNDTNEQVIKALNIRDSIIDKYYRHFGKQQNILIFSGGSRSGKTANIIRSAIFKNMYERFDLNIIAPSFKMLNLGSFIDAKTFIEEHDLDVRIPASASGQIKFDSGGVITFEVVTSENEAKRNRRNVYINEADGIQKEIANLIIGRASGKNFIDFNPTKKFWVDEYINDQNFLTSTWHDNPFLSSNQLEWFERLRLAGENAEIGSPERYAYEVYYLGHYSILSGKAFELSDFDIRDEMPDKFDYMISYSDPSLGVGKDYFASLLFGIKGRDVWAVDCIFSQFTKTGGFIEQLKKWDEKYNNRIDHYAEKNGTSGVVTKAAKEMYDGILNEVPNSDNKGADIIVYSTTAKKFKFVKSDKMMQFLNQCADFPNAEHDDAPDCLCRGAKILIKYFELE